MSCAAGLDPLLQEYQIEPLLLGAESSGVEARLLRVPETPVGNTPSPGEMDAESGTLPKSEKLNRFESNAILRAIGKPIRGIVSPKRDVALPPGLPGRQSPLILYIQMVSFVLAGLLVAIGHHLLYQRLDGKRVGTTTWTIAGHRLYSQQLIAFVATAVVFLSKTFFGICILKAFDQQLWLTAHRNLMKVRTFESLFSLPNDPAAFFNLETLVRAKAPTFLAALAWCLPLALIAVPGAIRIEPSSSISESTAIIPTVNLNPEANQFDSLAFYNPLRAYLRPSPYMLTFAAKILASGQIATWSSPCGSDCTYNQSFFGPSFSCSPTVSNQTGTAVVRWSAASDQGNTSDTLSIQWLSGYDNLTQSFSECTSYNSTYNIAVQFRGGVQHVDLQSVTLQSTFGTLDPLENWGPPSGNGAGNPDGYALLAAIKDSVAQAVSGFVAFSGQTGININQTLVLYSTLPSYGNLSASSSDNGATLVFPTNVPDLIEELLRNVTISLMSTSLWNTSTVATVESTANVYVYDPRTLWAGYGASIGATLIAVAMGVGAVLSNGGSGNRSFSLLVASTRNPRLDSVFVVSDDEKRLDEVRETRLKFSRLGGDVQPQRWAFGTAVDIWNET